MIKVIVDNKIGYTSSVIPFSSGVYPVWFFTNKWDFEFVKKEKVSFLN